MISEHRFLGKHNQLMTTFEKEQRFFAIPPFSKYCYPFAGLVAKLNKDLNADRNTLSQKASY